MLVYIPNPVQGQLNVTVENSVNNNYSMKIFSVEGKKIKSISNLASKTGIFHEDISNLSTGIYFIELTDKKGNILKTKFVKE